MPWVIMGGEPVEMDRAGVGVDDRGLLLGDGLFETMRACQGRVFRIERHLERLELSLRAFDLAIPWSLAQLQEMIESLIEKNGLESARIRLTVTRGAHKGSMSLEPPDSPTLLVTADPVRENPGIEDGPGITLAFADVRFSENNPTFRHKTLNRLPHLLARTEARRAKADEALILDERGNVATCSTGNIFAVHSNQLFTPPLTGPILPGITREAILEIARDQGIPIREDFFSPLMLAGADEVFMTNSVTEIAPVTSVNHRQVGSGKAGPIALKLSRGYKELVEK